MGHRKHRRIAERPRWEVTGHSSPIRLPIRLPERAIDFGHILESDLVYDDRAVPDILKAFPAVRVVDASDFVHEGLVSIEMSDTLISKDQWYRFLIQQGWHGVSLIFELDRISSPTAMLAWMKTWKN